MVELIEDKKINNPLASIGWMVLSGLAFSISTYTAKSHLTMSGSLNLVFLKAISILPLAFLFCFRKKYFKIINKPLLFYRAVLIFFATVLFLKSISYVPLKTSGTVTLFNPFIAAVLSLIFLRENLSGKQWLAIFGSILGAVLFLNSEFSGSFYGKFLATSGAFLAVVSFVITRKQTFIESSSAILFWTNFLILIFCLPFMLEFVHLLNPTLALNYTIFGLASFVTQYAAIKGFKYSKAGIASLFQMSGGVLIASFGFFIRSEEISIHELLGLLLVIIFSFSIVYKKPRARVFNRSEL